MFVVLFMRAMSVERYVESACWEPEVYGKKARTMFPLESLDGSKARRAAEIWRSAHKHATKHALALAKLGVHKEVANRLVAPFAMVEGIVTATEWDNFLDLRLAKDAQREIRQVAEGVKRELDREPREASVHVPLVSEDEFEVASFEEALLVSAGRCARVSYGFTRGKKWVDDLRLAKRLYEDGHLSPFEHPCVWHSTEFVCYNLRGGWKSFRAMLDDEEELRWRVEGL